MLEQVHKTVAYSRHRCLTVERHLKAAVLELRGCIAQLTSLPLTPSCMAYAVWSLPPPRRRLFILLFVHGLLHQSQKITSFSCLIIIHHHNTKQQI